MGWIKRKVQQWLQNDNECRPVSNSMLDSNSSLTFSIYGASGGKIVEFRHYDRKTDNTGYSLHIISDDEDFSNSIARITTLELLRG